MFCRLLLTVTTAAHGQGGLPSAFVDGTDLGGSGLHSGRVVVSRPDSILSLTKKR